MSSVRGRRGASPADGHRGSGRTSRATGRVPRVHTTRPVRTGLRSGASSRPGQRRTDRRPERRPSGPSVRRRPLFTGRAVLLVGLLLLLALTLAGPIRQYLAGQAELAQLAAEGRELDQRAADLEAQLDRQSDPAYAERQARERLAYVLPGDRLVIVVDGEAVEGDAGTLAAAAGTPEPRSWYEGLMESVAIADGDDEAAGEPRDGGAGE
ncbi:septum formation initiator family protein [Blastococcus saxobsidens]|uniref:Septum formation initiator family protein n=1 Tax=Blastococcus saxobsidens TaxID=138336 RepID=A0A6L9W0J9_9ACTN|nr:septum formation initiator family protein [Blastococcus saxobsidens]NEK85488.1 septum formation initiator family protein [Blastococcus saxobsidens]